MKTLFITLSTLGFLFSGEITATSGAIGGWNIGGSNTTISATNIELNSTNRYLLISDD